MSSRVSTSALVRRMMFLSVLGTMEGKAAGPPFAIRAAIPSPSSSREVKAILPCETGGWRVGRRILVDEGYQLR
jgi:hypothetical protein